MSELLDEARHGGYAIAAFTCYDLETASVVSSVAAEMRQPVMYLVSASAFEAAGGDDLLATVLTVADRGLAPACVQLDHTDSPALARRAVALGAAAVMADGSKLPLADNVDLVIAVVEATSAQRSEVEAELGHVSGNEDVAGAADAGQLTDPDIVAAFVEVTGTHCLAISIGNVHGIYRAPPKLDFARLAAIGRQTAIPLSLHGASGLADRDVRSAIAAGITKVNINTELRKAYIDTTVERVSEAVEGLQLLALHEWQRQAMTQVVREKLALCS